MVSEDGDAGSASDDESAPEKCFRFVDVLTEVPNGDTASATQLLLQDRGLTHIDSLEALRGLKKLELRGNRISDLSFLEMNYELCWLGLGKNRLRGISHLQNLRSLAVLDVSDNRIARLDGLGQLSELKALIAARNSIARIDGLAPKANRRLETVVLSHNNITECSLAKFGCLKKLSLAHNRLHAFPKLSDLPALAELRLNGNKITVVSPCVATLPSLSVIDVGNNLIAELSAIEPLRALRRLKSLNILGNSVAADMQDSGLRELLATLAKLEILNNRRCAGEGQKGKKRQRRGKADKASPAQMSVYGRSFEGKRAVFEDSDEEATAAGKSPRARKSGDGGGKETGWKDEASRKRRRPEGGAANWNEGFATNGRGKHWKTPQHSEAWVGKTAGNASDATGQKTKLKTRAKTAKVGAGAGEGTSTAAPKRAKGKNNARAVSVAAGVAEVGVGASEATSPAAPRNAERKKRALTKAAEATLPAAPKNAKRKKRALTKAVEALGAASDLGAVKPSKKVKAGKRRRVGEN